MENDDNNELLLSLTERMVERIPLDRHTFHEKLWIDLGKYTTDLSVIPPFRGNWQKIRRGGPQKILLCSSLRYWLDKIGHAKCLRGTQKTPSPSKLIYQTYLERVRKDTETQDYFLALCDHWSEEMRGYLGEATTPSSMCIYHHGILFQGQALYTSTSNNTSFGSILAVGALLYDQLWWFRTVQGLSVERSLGFCVTLTDQEVLVTLLILEVPSSIGLGERFQLYEYTQTYSMLSTTDRQTPLRELGIFVLQAAQLDNPFMSSERLAQHSPGCMLLHLSILDQVDAAQKWIVVPTMTGSLVLRCQSIEAVTELLSRAAVNELFEEMQNLSQQMDLKSDECRWYVKIKTPVFGEYWDTATVAINGTRRLLLEQMKKKISVQDRERAEHWLRMHPVNSLIEPHRNITILRDMGTRFEGQLSRMDFKAEFLSLMRRVLVFQSLAHIVHGDIHEGNMVWNEHAAPNFQLHLIDWDEALRKQPCRRKISSDLDRRRYPNELVDFPELYTKYQLINLFNHFWNQYYSSSNGRILRDESSTWSPPTTGRMSTTEVNPRYEALNAFLAS